MKVLLISDYSTPTGGAELTLFTLREGLRQRGHDVRIFASSARPDGMDTLADEECFGTTSRFRAFLQTANIWAMQRLSQVLSEFQPDIVHVSLFLTQLSPLILPLLRHIPTLYYVVWYRPICPLGTKRLPNGMTCQDSVGKACYQNRCLPLHDWLPLMLQQHLWQRWSNVFDSVVANSDSVKQVLQQSGIDVKEVIWHGVPIRPLRPSISSPPTVVFAGRLVPEKGVKLLIQAFAKVITQIPTAQLLIAGTGEEEEYLKQMIIDLELTTSVRLLGYLPRQELEDYFARAWVQAVPSLWSEPFGMVAAEAQMRGTAVVASDSGGLREIVKHGETGFLFPTGQVEALTESLLTLLQNRDLAEQMGQDGRKIAVAQFSEASCVEKFLHHYQTLLKQKTLDQTGRLN